MSSIVASKVVPPANIPAADGVICLAVNLNSKFALKVNSSLDLGKQMLPNKLMPV